MSANGKMANISKDKDEKDNINENSLKRKLKNMCSRPKRLIVEFYDDKTDKSLHAMIRSMAHSSMLFCSEDGCGKPHLYHTDYLYHANGCIEIKYLEDSSNV